MIIMRFTDILKLDYWIVVWSSTILSAAIGGEDEINTLKEESKKIWWDKKKLLKKIRNL